MAFITHIGDYFATKPAVWAASLSANTSGPTIDRLGYDHLLLEMMTTGVVGTNPTFDYQIYHSTADLTTAFVAYTPDFIYPNNNQGVSSAGAIQVTTNTAAKLDVDLQKANRYLRVQVTLGGTSPAATCAAVALIGQREGTIPGNTA